MKTTVSVIKADVGSIPGHVKVPDELLEIAEESMAKAKKQRIIKSYHVSNCGDDLELIMSHDKGEDNPKNTRTRLEHLQESRRSSEEAEVLWSWAGFAR